MVKAGAQRQVINLVRGRAAEATDATSLTIMERSTVLAKQMMKSMKGISHDKVPLLVEAPPGRVHCCKVIVFGCRSVRVVQIPLEGFRVELVSFLLQFLEDTLDATW